MKKYRVSADLRPHVAHFHDPSVDIELGEYRWRWVARLRVRDLSRDMWGRTLFHNIRITNLARRGRK